MQGKTTTEIGYLAGCSESLVRECMSDRKDTAPGEGFSRAIAKALGADHEELFPWDSQTKKESA